MKPITHYWQNINFVSVVLAPVSGLFCLLVSLRRQLYRLGWLKSKTSRIPVIVVGNIYIGGNGKTPFVIWLVNQLKSKGYRPGIVSRGYGALSERDCGVSWPRLVNLQQDSRLFGDEPSLIHQSTQCPVVVAPLRNQAVEKIQNETDCDVIISDDGLQHYAMSRYIEINITDARRGYGNGLCLPAGPLREAKSRLRSVDYIVYNVSQNKSGLPSGLTHGREFAMDYETERLLPLSGESQIGHDESMTLDDFKGKIVHAVAGIGEPDNLFNMLREAGLKVIEHPFADHYQYQLTDLNFNSSEPIIMTEKDAVKCRDFKLSQCWYLPIKANIDNKLTELISEQLKRYNR